jgi:hypothetical protein
MLYRIEFIAGENHPKRGVAFLISENKKVTAKPIFDSLNKKNKNIERSLRTRFDAWIDRQPDKPARYHGWDQSEFQGRYTNCFVFKVKNNRFYGFLCNPKSFNHSYRVCILVRHAFKKEHETDETELKQVEELGKIEAIQKTINDYFRGKQ